MLWLASNSGSVAAPAASYTLIPSPCPASCRLLCSVPQTDIAYSMAASGMIATSMGKVLLAPEAQGAAAAAAEATISAVTGA